MFDRNSSASFRASMRSLLLPSFSRALRRGLHTTSSLTCGLIKSYNQAAQVPSSNVTCRLPRRPFRKSRMVMALVSITHSITSLPEEFRTAMQIASLCTSIPIYFTLSIKRVLLSVVGSVRAEHSKPYSKRGALLYRVGLSFTITSVGIFFGPVLTWTLHPVMGKVNSGQSPLPEGMERWGLLGLGLFILGCGSFLLIHPKKSVELMFPRTEA